MENVLSKKDVVLLLREVYEYSFFHDSPCKFLESFLPTYLDYLKYFRENGVDRPLKPTTITYYQLLEKIELLIYHVREVYFDDIKLRSYFPYSKDYINERLVLNETG